MKLFHALTYTNPNAPFSVKALIYAILCTLFGTACLHCGIWIMGANGAFFGEVSHHPYEMPAMGIALWVAFILLCITTALWFFTVDSAHRKWLNVLITAAVVILCFAPFWILMGYIHYFGEQVGQMILYG